MQAMRWREAVGAIVGLFVVTRGALFLIATLLERNIPLAYHGPTYSSAPVLSSLTGTDSIYLLGIAAQGYHAEPITKGFLDWAYFPLYPLATRLVSYVTFGDVALAGVIVANVAFVAALLVLYRLAVPSLGHDVAVRSLAFVALAPGAVAFAMAYTDSLFLLLAAGTFLAAEQRRWALMAALYALASLTRLQGVLLGLPLLVMLLQASRERAGFATEHESGAESDAGAERGSGADVAGRPSTTDGTDPNEGAEPTPSQPPPRLSVLAWLAAGPIALAAFGAYLGATFGDPLGMIHAQQAWSDIGKPGTGASGAIPVVDRFDPLVLLLIGVLLFYVFLLVFLRRDKVPWAYRVMILIAFLTVFVSLRLQSLPRYMAVVWPFSWVLAKNRSAWWGLIGLPAFAILFVVFAFLNFTQTLAP
jgi:Dolichyl-phosphate-mannose-protein mannosyltransferase